MNTEPEQLAEESATSDHYVVVARRYRPQTFTDLVGQGHVSQALCNAITQHRVGHAYLFTGARGTGKTSTARIFAKALCCERGPTVAPCGECDLCQCVARGEDVDVLEIDGASNRGIDEIRQLRSNVSIRPSRARYKIYIIDEVHMLTTPAFNALLKTLEEPPGHVKFFFCTTDPEKVPITVRSRCQRYDFAPVEAGEIAKRLASIVTAEHRQAEPEALELLARKAAGSMRDSQSLLEQLLAFGSETITLADVHRLLGTAHGGRLAAIMQRLLDRNLPELLTEIDGAIAEGVEPGQLVEQLLGEFRDIMAATVGCQANVLLYASAGDLPRLVECGQKLGLETILAMMQILDHTLVRLRQSGHARTLLEMAAVRLCRLENLDDLATAISRLASGGGVALPSSARPPVAITSAEPAQKKTTGLTENAPAAATVATKPAPEVTPAPAMATSVVPLAPENVAAIWQQALVLLGDLTADYARSAERVTLSPPNRLVASFRAKYTFAKQSCETGERRLRLEESLSQAAGSPVVLQCELLPDLPAVGPAAAPAPTQRERIQRSNAHPLVKQAMELFGGEVVRTEQKRAAAPTVVEETAAGEA